MKTIAALALLLALATAVEAKDRYNPKAHKPEWQYVDSEDPAEVEKLGAKLLKRYKNERQAARLAALYRKGRPYFRGLSSNETLTLTCADGLEREFTWYLPKRYSPKKPTGLLIFLHGAVSQGPPGGGAHEAREIGRAVDDLGFIKVGPSTYGKHDWGETAVRAHVSRVLDMVKQRFNVDEDRVYLAGDSDGGRGTFAVAETEATFLAAGIPTIGAPGGVTRFVNLRNLPWLMINGAKDGLFKIDRVRENVEAMKAAGFDLDFREIADAGHDPFLFRKMKEDVCAFIEAHRRDPLPAKVDWQVDPSRGEWELGFPGNSFRWIRIEETGGAAAKGDFGDKGGLIRSDLPRVRAVKAEGANRVEVTTSGVKRLTVLVSSEMFDLEKEIEVLVNGKPAYKQKLGPDVTVILEEARRYNDRKLVFENRITLEVE